MLTSTPVRSKLNDSDVQALPDEKGRIVRKSKYHPDKTRELLTLDESDEEKNEDVIPSFSMNSSNMGDSSVIESYMTKRYENFSNQLPPTPYTQRTESMEDHGNQASKRPPLVQIDTNLEDNPMIREYMTMRESQFNAATRDLDHHLGNQASKRPLILEASPSEDTQDENSIQSVIENNQNIVMTPQLKKYHQCYHCGNKYSAIATLHMHKKKKHKDLEIQNMNTGSVIVCEICQKSFKSKAGLSTHKRWKHSGK